MLKGREEVLGSHLGKRRAFKGHIDRITENKICISKVCDLESGKVINHLWIDRPHFEKKYGLRKHVVFTFTGVISEYVGLDEDYKQVMKNGLTQISKVRYKYKLRRSQR